MSLVKVKPALDLLPQAAIGLKCWENGSSQSLAVDYNLSSKEVWSIICPL